MRAPDGLHLAVLSCRRRYTIVVPSLECPSSSFRTTRLPGTARRFGQGPPHARRVQGRPSCCVSWARASREGNPVSRRTTRPMRLKWVGLLAVFALVALAALTYRTREAN